MAPEQKLYINFALHFSLIYGSKNERTCGMGVACPNTYIFGDKCIIKISLEGREILSGGGCPTPRKRAYSMKS